ncbi:homeobox protein ESX1-like [Chionomys nivalis]|uniref:homeobox protein ESX1-like n=1 Tax=Chionomys nivalis TaxID=269649 RepID=UPI00259664A7|nr:homeobox protein ESX1-like [Chionomys nivalis]
MESKYVYFDLDYYGVGFYEEEIMTESQQRLAEAAARRCYGRGVRVLHELGDTDYVNREYEHHYYHERNETRAIHSEPGRGKLGGPGKAAGAVSQPSNKRRVKYKFTYGQVCELDRVFQETQYPDALQRKALAELIHVDECKVKAWFKNRRSKYRNKQMEFLLSNDTSGSLNNFPPKKDEDPESASVAKASQQFLLCQ